MSDAVSALAGASFDGSVKVAEAGLRGMVTLRGDLGSEAMAIAVKAAVGLSVPGQREHKTGKAGGVVWMSPDELLILCDHDKADAVVAKCDKAFGAEHHLAVNVSDARAVFIVEGAGAREVIAKGAPVDLSPGAFGPGEVRRSRIGQIAAAFWMTDAATFEVVCFRSVAQHMFDWLSVAAAKDSLPGHF